jgi:hypothetical protein
MRFILDSHPDLACPPETSLTAACAQLMRVWNTLETAGADEPPATDAAGSPRALAAVRATVDDVYAGYLERRGKSRWCDKSLGSHQQAELAAQLYPEARFICLYRHCMDVIASGAEACPWGLHRFGFDGFAAHNPGNSVAAIGSYWLSTVQSVMAFEDSHPVMCHRVRYEDLVTEPEQTAAAIFSFLGAEQVPGIAQACFRTPHEGNGPGDEEIWFSDGITADSVGRGVQVPAAALTPHLRNAVNDALARLGYRTVDDEWNAAAGRIDVRADADPSEQARDTAQPRQSLEADETARMIEERLRSRPGRDLRDVSTLWPAVAGQTVAIVVESAHGGHAELRWNFPASPDAVRTDVGPADGGSGGQPVCTIIAGLACWHALLSGEANIVTEMTSGRLRCVNRRDRRSIRSDELHAVSWLLGLATVPLVRAPSAELAGAMADSA